MRIVSYIRVSTRAQEASGLGLDAQRQAVEGFAKHHRAEIVAEYREVETGSGRWLGTPSLGASLGISDRRWDAFLGPPSGVSSAADHHYSVRASMGLRWSRCAVTRFVVPAGESLAPATVPPLITTLPRHLVLGYTHLANQQNRVIHK